MADILTFGDQLRIEGVNFKGFGVIPKYVMIDKDLTIEAKTIYAYFCSYAGNGNSTFPGRSKILDDLKVGKDAYYKHLRLLIEQGYIVTEQTKRNGSKFCNNIYTLISNPKKFEYQPDNDAKGKIYSSIRVSGLKSAGYGMIPKAVMIDERLPLKAKGIYAYFSSFTGAESCAFPKLETILYHLQISAKTYYCYYKYLTELNYITVVQRRVKGKMDVSDYYINDNPDESKPSVKAIFPYSTTNLPIGKKSDTENQDTVSPIGRKSDAENQDTVSPIGKKSDTEKSDTQKPNAQIPHTQNQDTIINNTNKTNSTINSLDKKQSFNQNPLPEGRGEELNQLTIDDIIRDQKIGYSYCSDIDRATNLVHYLTCWNPSRYEDEYEQKVYNLFNEALIEMFCSTKTMNLRGSLVTSKNVIDQLNCNAEFFETYIDISGLEEESMDAYIKGSESTEIRRPLQYMKACIWEALLSGGIGTYEDVRRWSN